MPENVQQVVQLLSSTRNTSLYIGIDSNGDLQVAKKAPAVIVHSQLSCPGTGTLPPALIPPFLIVTLRDDPHSLPFSSQCPVSYRGGSHHPFGPYCLAMLVWVLLVHSSAF